MWNYPLMIPIWGNCGFMVENIKYLRSIRKSSFALTPFSNENNTLLKDTKGMSVAVIKNVML